MADVIAKAELARELDLSRPNLATVHDGASREAGRKSEPGGSRGMSEGERLFMARRLVGEPSAEERTRAGADTGGGSGGRESVKTHSKTVAKLAEQKRRRELEEGFNGLEDTRDERIKSMKELAAAYLEEYRMRHRSVTFAEYAVGNVTRHLGELMAVDVTDKTVKIYQTARLKEKEAPKTINEEVGFLLRLLGEAGEPIRARFAAAKGAEAGDTGTGGQGVHP